MHRNPHHHQLSALTRLDLSHNQLSEISLPQQAGGRIENHLSTLDTLLLSHNKFKSIHPRFFEDLAKLTCLDMSDNLLTELPHHISCVSGERNGEFHA